MFISKTAWTYLVVKLHVPIVNKSVAIFELTLEVQSKDLNKYHFTVPCLFCGRCELVGLPHPAVLAAQATI